MLSNIGVDVVHSDISRLISSPDLLSIGLDVSVDVDRLKLALISC